jgi:hypothetical protein
MRQAGPCGWVTAHRGEEEAMPTVIQVPVSEREENVGPRFVGQQDRDEHRYMAAWIADQRRQFQRELRTARVEFLVRMAVLA